MGCYPSDTVDGTRLACLVSGLYGDRRDRYPAIGSYHYPRDQRGGAALHLWRMSGFAGQAFYPALLYRYHVPCGDRCRDEYDRPEDLDGTSRHDVGRRRLRHEPLFHIPYGGMLLRGFYLAKSLSERILRL